jgi:hypothetical protein
VSGSIPDEFAFTTYSDDGTRVEIDLRELPHDKQVQLRTEAGQAGDADAVRVLTELIGY